MIKKNATIVFMAAIVIMSSLTACQKTEDEHGKENSAGQAEEIIEEMPDETEASDTEQETPQQETPQQETAQQEDSAPAEPLAGSLENKPGDHFDVIEPDAADDDWYMNGCIYTDENGNQLEVFFNDYGTLEFAVNGLSLYFTAVDHFEYENNWRIYTCDDDTMIIYYPGEPAHLEIADGDYAGLYEAGSDKAQ